MDNKTIDDKITDGCIFSITVGGVSYFYRSYVYNGGTFIKYIRTNGVEIHLGRYRPEGMVFNKKYQNIELTMRTAHIIVLETLLDSVKRSKTIPAGYVFEIVESQCIQEALEMYDDLIDQTDYLYRIGVQ